MNKKIIFIALSIVVLASLFIIMKPRTVSHETEATVTHETNSAAVLNSQAGIVKVDLVVKNNQIVNGSDIIKASEGDTITINAIADVTDEIHIHGLDKHLELEANKPGSVIFKADKSGRFEFELEGAKKDLGVIEIQPKQ